MESSILEVWAAPAAPQTIPEGWGAKLPTFWNGFWGRRGHPGPKNQRFPAGQKPCPKCEQTCSVAFKKAATGRGAGRGPFVCPCTQASGTSPHRRASAQVF